LLSFEPETQYNQTRLGGFELENFYHITAPITTPCAKLTSFSGSAGAGFASAEGTAVRIAVEAGMAHYGKSGSKGQSAPTRMKKKSGSEEPLLSKRCK